MAQRVVPGAVQRTKVPGAAVIFAIAVWAGADRQQNVRAANGVEKRWLGIFISALVN